MAARAVSRATPVATYYGRELGRRLAHYAAKRRRGYRDRGSLAAAADAILAERAERGFEAGGHFRGVWPRDLCFASRGLVAAGYDDAVRETCVWMLEELSDVFYTDFHDRYHAATPREGVDTFPAVVIALATADPGALGRRADAIADLAALHRRKFFDEEVGLVSGRGSSWWDSAARPREAYDTAMVLAAIDRLERAGVETAYAGAAGSIRAALIDRLWNGRYLDERRGSGVLSCDANVVPLYFGLLDEDRVRTVADSLAALETPAGLRMRSRPFAAGEVHPFFLLHRDYHCRVWPWNDLMYANGLARYGLDDRARRGRDRTAAALEPYGNFLEVLRPDGRPYVKRGYASAEDFTVAAALWAEYERERDR